MKRFFLIMLMTTVLLAGCTPAPTPEPTPFVDYDNGIFVSPDGDDTAAGTAEAPLASVQTALERAQAGQTVYLADGTYYGKLTLPSGEEDNPITLTALPGATATVTATVPLPNPWQPYRDGIYMTDVTAILDRIDTDAVQLFMDDQSLVEARYPDADPSDLLKAERGIAGAGTDASQLVTDKEFSDEILGARIVVWPGAEGLCAWDQSSALVTAVNGKTLIFDKPIGEGAGEAYVPTAGNAYYLTGSLCLLDAPGEFYLDGNTLYCYLPDGAANAAFSLRAKGRTVDGSGCHDMIVKDLRVFGGGIYFANATRCQILSCTIRYADHGTYNTDNCYFHETATTVTGSHNTVSRCDIGLTAFSGLTVGGSDSSFTDNTIHDVDYIGSNYAGIFIRPNAENLDISYNSVTDCGRVGIYLMASSSYEACRITHNLIDRIACLTSDCGAIYTWNTDGGGTEIAYNMVKPRSTDAKVGSMTKGFSGIYLDNYCRNFTVHHNVVNGVGGNANGLQINLSNQNTLCINNTVVNCKTGLMVYGAATDEADCATLTFANNLMVNVVNQLTYYASEKGKPVSYVGPMIQGVVPITRNAEHRMISSNNAVESTLGDGFSLPEGSTAIDGGKEFPGFTEANPDIGAVAYGSPLFAYGPRE